MLLTRRTFIKLVPSALLIIVWPRVFAASRDNLVTRILPVYLDTLMPADETPSATNLQVDRKLLHRADNETRYFRLLVRGCQWLEQTAQEEYAEPFSEISEDQRILIVQRMSAMKHRTLAHEFFRQVQADLFTHYYSHAASWKNLGMDHPPQPLGYPDYHQSPGQHP